LFDIYTYHLEFSFELSISLCEECQAAKDEEEGIVWFQATKEEALEATNKIP
jgi:hypothetical protein